MKISLLCVSLVLFAPFVSFAEEKEDIHSMEESMSTRPIDQVLKSHAKALMSLPGVVGTGQGLCEKKPCIKVFVIKKTRDLEQKLPKDLDGYPVVIEETGEIKALPKK